MLIQIYDTLLSLRFKCIPCHCWLITCIWTSISKTLQDAIQLSLKRAILLVAQQRRKKNAQTTSTDMIFCNETICWIGRWFVFLGKIKVAAQPPTLMIAWLADFYFDFLVLLPLSATRCDDISLLMARTECFSQQRINLNGNCRILYQNKTKCDKQTNSAINKQKCSNLKLEFVCRWVFKKKEATSIFSFFRPDIFTFGVCIF